MKIIFSGGGTIGAVSPLLAIKEEIDQQKVAASYLWVGTRKGIEADIVAKAGIPYKGIYSAKWRRYLSVQNFLIPLQLLFGFIQSLSLIKKFKPDYILSAGGFVSVPLVWAARFKKVKAIIHQPDIKPGLANRLMAKSAWKISVSFEPTLKYFPKDKTIVMGNPVEKIKLAGDKQRALKDFNLEEGLPTLLVLGGSQGAEKINQLMIGAITQLVDFCQIIHVAGNGNIVEWVDKDKFGVKASRYHAFEYLYENLNDAYAVADLVVTRAGLSTLTELAALGKATILIPIPRHLQVENAQYFVSRNAVMSLDQDKLTPDEFVTVIRDLLGDRASLERLGQNIKEILPPDASQKFVKLILDDFVN